MSPTDRGVFPGSRVTRRHVVATGVKLAYAAPLLAASFKLSAIDASAQDTGCTTGENCAAGVIVNCGPDDICACVQRAGDVFSDLASGFACVDRFCSEIPCTKGSDCDSGLCISAPGCCGDPDPFCAFACGTAPLPLTSRAVGGWQR